MSKFKTILFCHLGTYRIDQTLNIATKILVEGHIVKAPN